MAPKRKRSERAPDDDNTMRNNKRFAYLKPRVRYVAEGTIKSKWSTLPEPDQERVREMFRSLERPVIVRQRDERKRIEAQAAVAAVVKKYVHFHIAFFCSMWESN
jgi:kinetochore protein Fta7